MISPSVLQIVGHLSLSWPLTWIFLGLFNFQVYKLWRPFLLNIINSHQSPAQQYRGLEMFCLGTLFLVYCVKLVWLITQNACWFWFIWESWRFFHFYPHAFSIFPGIMSCYVMLLLWLYFDLCAIGDTKNACWEWFVWGSWRFQEIIGYVT